MFIRATQLAHLNPNPGVPGVEPKTSGSLIYSPAYIAIRDVTGSHFYDADQPIPITTNP